MKAVGFKPAPEGGRGVTCVVRAAHGCGNAGRLPQDQAHSLGVGLALVVGLGHNGRGEEHVAQGAALVLVHIRLSAVLQRAAGQWSRGEEQGRGGDERGWGAAR